MSNFIPPNIIQTPDFAGLAKERIDRKRQEETNKNAFLDQFSEAQGLYLDGDRPAVQDAWNKVQSTIDMVAENDTPESRRQLKQVYADYAKVAGTAQVLADQHRTQVASYKADPTKYAMSGGDFFSWDEQFRTKTRSFDDMQSALDNPNVLPSSASYALLNPFEQAQTLIGETANIASTFYDASGALDAKGLRSRIKDIAAKKIMANPEAMERAIIWGATTSNNPAEGFAGDSDGKINSLEELNMIKELPQDQRDAYMNAYLESLVDNYIDLTPGLSQSESGKTKLSGYSMTMQVEGEFSGVGAAPLEEVNVDMISLPGTVKRGGLGFSEVGVDANGNYYVTVETKEEETYEENFQEKTRTVIKSETRKANPNEVSAILSVYGDKYDFSGLTPPPPVEQAATETEATPAEAPAETTTTETTDATAVTIDPKDDAMDEDPLNLNIFTDETTEEKPAEASIKENKEDDKSFAYADLDDTGKKAVQKLRLKQQLERGSKADRERAKNITFTEEESSIISNWQQTVPMRNGFPSFKDVPKNTYDIDISTKPAEAAAEEAPAEAAAEEAPTKETKEQPAEETKEQPAEETKNRDYIVMQNGVVVFRDEYDKYAGKPSSTGTPYPDTFEEYAKIFQQTIKNEAQNPINIVAGKNRTLQGEELEQIPAAKEEEISTEKEGFVADMPADNVSTKGSVKDSEFRSGAPENPTVYIQRGGFIPNPDSPKEGVPIPSREKVLPKTAKSFYTTKRGKKLDFEWTAENVKLAIDRWNGEFAKQTGIDYQTIIDVSNQFGIPVELIIGLAAKESELGNSNRPSKTKNLYNWGNTTKGDKRKGSEQDKKNTYFKTFEDGLYAWADGFVRLYRPDSGHWMELFQENAPKCKIDEDGNKIGIGGSFVVQRGNKKGSRYAANPEQEEAIRDMITWNIVMNLSRKDPNKKSTRYINKRLKI